jgi:hypothetical protein
MLATAFANFCLFAIAAGVMVLVYVLVTRPPSKTIVVQQSLPRRPWDTPPIPNTEEGIDDMSASMKEALDALTAAAYAKGKADAAADPTTVQPAVQAQLTEDISEVDAATAALIPPAPPAPVEDGDAGEQTS